MNTQNGKIIGCYTLDLYCAVDHTKLGYEFYNKDFGQFTGRTESACIRTAKKYGWTVTVKRVLCPMHSNAKSLDFAT